MGISTYVSLFNQARHQFWQWTSGLARTVKATSSVVDLAMTSESAGASVLEYVRETRGETFSGTLLGAKWIVESLRVFIKNSVEVLSAAHRVDDKRGFG